MGNKKYVNIRVERATINKLKEAGKKSETYDDLINRLMQKSEGTQSWRKFILESAAIDSSNEIHNKGINADALRGLCLEYDVYGGPSSQTHCRGLSFLHFFLEKIVGVKIPIGGKERKTWEEQIAGLKKAKKMVIEPLIDKPGGKEKGTK